MAISIRIKKASLLLIAATLVATVTAQFPFYYVESIIYDARIRIKPVKAPHPDIELIVIDFKSVEELKHLPTATDHFAAIKKIASYEPKLIIDQTDLSKLKGSPQNLSTLAKQLRKFKNYWVPIDGTGVKGDVDAFKLPIPFNDVQTMSSPISADTRILAEDGVTRRMFESYQENKNLEKHAAGLLNPSILFEGGIKGVFELLGSKQTYIDFRPTGTYHRTPYHTVLEAKTDLSKLKNKLIIIGKDTNEDSKDYAKTPFSRIVTAMPTVEVRANMLDTFIQNSALIRLNKIWDFILSVFLGFIALLAIFSKRPGKGIVLLVLSALSVFGFSILVLSLFGVWFGLAQALISTVLLFYIVLPVRLVFENREKLNQYRKNAELASQVSHDIRSPLAALNMTMGTIDSLPADKKLLIENATRRINDIANNLLLDRKQTLLQSTAKLTELDRKECVMLISSLEAIISEKREQFRNKIGMRISGEFKNGYGLFIRVNSNALARVLSNLINNSVEACEGIGHVRVEISQLDNNAVISIIDSGSGIPENILPLLGKQPIQSKKTGQSGSGLGLYYANEFANDSGGTLQLSSSAGTGTTINLIIPLTPAPFWFVQELKLQNVQYVVSVDDDETIHQLWDNRMSSINSTGIKIERHRFTSPSEFKNWVSSTSMENVVYLVDLELLGHKEDGLKMIEKLGIARKSILVTSHFESKSVQTRAEFTGVKIIPKGLAAIIPINKPADKTMPDVRRSRVQHRMMQTNDLFQFKSEENS